MGARLCGCSAMRVLGHVGDRPCGCSCVWMCEWVCAQSHRGAEQQPGSGHGRLWILLGAKGAWWRGGRQGWGWKLLPGGVTCWCSAWSPAISRSSAKCGQPRLRSAWGLWTLVRSPLYSVILTHAAAFWIIFCKYDYYLSVLYFVLLKVLISYYYKRANTSVDFKNTCHLSIISKFDESSIIFYKC